MIDYISKTDAIDCVLSQYCASSDETEEALGNAIEEIKKRPTADVVEVIRCKDCVHWNSETNGCKRNPSVQPWYENDFCKYGKKMEATNEQT